MNTVKVRTKGPAKRLFDGVVEVESGGQKLVEACRRSTHDNCRQLDMVSGTGMQYVAVTALPFHRRHC